MTDTLTHVHLDAMTRVTAQDGPSAPYLTISADRYTPVVHLFLGDNAAGEGLDAADRQLDQIEAAIAVARRLIASHRAVVAGPDDEPTDDPNDEPVMFLVRFDPADDEAAAAAIIAAMPAPGHDLEPVRSILGRVVGALPFAPRAMDPAGHLMTESEARALDGDR